ncbi:hypothetical protein NN561_015272 [Cricetulus griseus]
MTCDSNVENRWQRWAAPSTQALARAKLVAAGSPPPSLPFGSFRKAPATGQWVQEVPVRGQALHGLASVPGGKNKPTKLNCMKWSARSQRPGALAVGGAWGRVGHCEEAGEGFYRKGRTCDSQKRDKALGEMVWGTLPVTRGLRDSTGGWS